MDDTALFVAVYATCAELGAIGLRRVGLISARRQPGTPHGDVMPWPHEGSVQLHSVVGWVAVTAAVLLASVMAVIHHGPADLTVLSVPILLGILMACHAVLTRRRPIRGSDVGS